MCFSFSFSLSQEEKLNGKSDHGSLFRNSPPSFLLLFFFFLLFFAFFAFFCFFFAFFCFFFHLARAHTLQEKKMWVLFLSNVITWSMASVPPGSTWVNTGLISCSGSSFSYNNVPAQGITRILMGDAGQWGDPGPPWEYDSGSLEVFLWSLNAGPKLGYLTADGEQLLPGNTTVTLPTQETKLSFQHNTSVPRIIEFQVYSPTAATLLFSCVQFRAHYENKTTTTITTQVSSGSTGAVFATGNSGSVLTTQVPTTVSGVTGGVGLTTGESLMLTSTSGLPAWQELLWNHQRGGRSSAAFPIDECLVLISMLLFLMTWVIPARVRLPARLKLSHVVKKDDCDFWATNLGVFSVVAIGRDNKKGSYEPPSPHLVGRLFCPFIGVHDSYHVYAIGNRIPLNGALDGDVSLIKKLFWLEEVASMIAQAHAHSVKLNPEARHLWVDPVSQNIAMADYAGHRGNKQRNVHALGKLMEILLGHTGHSEIDTFVDLCLNANPPGARECVAAIRCFRTLQVDRGKLRASAGR